MSLLERSEEKLVSSLDSWANTASFFRDNPQWSVGFQRYPWGLAPWPWAHNKTFITTRAVDKSTPEEGEGYRWNIDIDDTYDVTVAQVFGERSSACGDIKVYTPADWWRYAEYAGRKAVSFCISSYDKPRKVTEADIAGLARVDALFDRLGYQMTPAILGITEQQPVASIAGQS